MRKFSATAKINAAVKINSSVRDPISKPLSIRFQTETRFAFVPAVRVGFDAAIGISLAECLTEPRNNNASRRVRSDGVVKV